MNQYELAVLYHPDFEMDLEKAATKVEKIIVDNAGKILNKDVWGKRKLAYPIAKQEQAIYVLYTLEMPSASVGKMESTLNITSEVIRYLIVKPDLKAIAKANKRQEVKAAKAAKATAHRTEVKEEE